MGAFLRGIKNAFRNLVRTLSVTLILALSIGLALIMLLSYQTVEKKIVNIRSTIGNIITISPAGVRGFEGGGEPLTTAQADMIRKINNITKVNETLQDRLTAGEGNNLAAAIEPGTLGKRFGDRNRQSVIIEKGNTALPDQNMQVRKFSTPISINGLSNLDSLEEQGLKVTSGELFNFNSEAKEALVGAQLASKNNLSVGSTFTAYNTVLTVKGIYDAGNQFANSGIYLPLKTLQSLSEQIGQVSVISVTVNDINNVDAAVSAIKDKLGSDKVDVTSNKESASEAVAPLENIKKISLYSLSGSLAAGAVITLLIMMMVVRERRREIGVLKAIGASNFWVVTQFVWESLVLTFMGAVVGVAAGVLFSNPVLDALVANSTTAEKSVPGIVPVGMPSGGGPGFGRVIRLGGLMGDSIQNTLRDLQATVGIEIILYGLLAAVLIAVLGSAIPAWLIAKVKPAEVMRAD